MTNAKTDNSLLWDIRCDLHIRFLTDNILCYDTVENGKRQFAVVEMD